MARSVTVIPARSQKVRTGHKAVQEKKIRDSKQIVRSMEYIFRAKHSRRMITGIHWQVVSMMKECPFRRFGII